MVALPPTRTGRGQSPLPLIKKSVDTLSGDRMLLHFSVSTERCGFRGRTSQCNFGFTGWGICRKIPQCFQIDSALSLDSYDVIPGVREIARMCPLPGQCLSTYKVLRMTANRHKTGTVPYASEGQGAPGNQAAIHPDSPLGTRSVTSLTHNLDQFLGL